MNFMPKRPDGRSYRDVAVDLFKGQSPETVIPYKQIADALGLSAKNDMTMIQGTVNQANKVLLRLHKRGVQNVRGVGYRVIRANEHMLVATTHQSKAERQMRKSIAFFDGANLSEMTETERKLHIGQSMLAQATYSGFQHLNKRISRIEDLLAGTKTIQG